MGAVGAEAVIDGQGQQAPTVIAGPVGGDGQQGDGVSAAGQGQGEGAVGVRLKPRGQPFANLAEPGGAGGIQPALRAGQAKRVRRAAARVRRAAAPASA